MNLQGRLLDRVVRRIRATRQFDVAELSGEYFAESIKHRRREWNAVKSDVSEWLHVVERCEYRHHNTRAQVMVGYSRVDDEGLYIG